MTAQLTPAPVFSAYTASGAPLVGGQLFTYAAGTSTPQATYVDSTQTTPNTNPVILNAMGQAAVWLNPALAYKLVLQDAAGNPQYSADNIKSSIFGAPLAGWGTPTGGAAVANFPGAGPATLAQCSTAIAQIIATLKAAGIYAA